MACDGTFDDQIAAAQRLLHSLSNTTEAARDAEEWQAVAEGAIEALHVSLEELRVAGEEIAARTEEVAAGREVLDAERYRYQELFRDAPDPYLVSDLRGVIREVNKAAEHLLATPAAHLEGSLLVSFVHPDNRPEFRRRLAAVTTPGGGKPSSADWEAGIVPRGGGVVPSLLRVVTNRSRGAEPGLRWMIRDLTTQRESAAVAVSEGMLRRLLAAAPMGMYATGPERRVVFANRRAEEITGRTLTGVPVEELVSAVYRDARGRVQRWAEVPSRAGEPMTVRLRIARPDGSLRWVDQTASALPARGALPGGLIVALQDVTTAVEAREEREGLQRQLLAARQQELAGRLAEDLAHDFGNVLLVVTGHCEMLLAGDLAPAQRERVDEILAAAQRADRLVEGLLHFGRPAATTPVDVDLNTLVSSAPPMLEAVLGERVTLEVRVPAAPSWVSADPDEIRQLLVNLALNARDAMLGGGEVTIEVGREKVPDPGSSGELVSLTVADTGVGMDTETLARAGEAFFTTKGARRGSGLGLTIVQGIVERDGGSLTVESEPGVGTTMRILLPEATAPTHAPPAPATAAHAGATVLVVDDDAAVRTLMAESLRGDYEVIVAYDGADALEKAAAHPRPIDVLVTDMTMPGVQGAELAMRLRERHPETRVLVVSGQKEPSRRRIRRVRAAFLAKPFHPATLREAVADLLPGPRH